MQCKYYNAHLCRSCTLIEVPSPTRVAQTQAQIDELLAPYFAATASTGSAPAKSDIPAPSPEGDGGLPKPSPAHSGSTSTPPRWLPPITGPDTHFRNKAKMVVAGSANEPTLGILDKSQNGIDLTDCPLYPEPVRALIAALPAFIKRAQLPPYRIAKRKGELKHVLITIGDGDALMLRLVLASTKPLDRIREHLPRLQAQFPKLRTVTANINPAHTAIIEGDEEILLAGPGTLPVTQGRVTLEVRPQSFLQTNTTVASQLYAQVSEWIDEYAAHHSSAEATPRRTHQPDCSATPTDTAPESADKVHTQALTVWDLFCGVGGFALHAAQAAAPHTTAEAPHSPSANTPKRRVENAPEAPPTSSANAPRQCGGIAAIAPPSPSGRAPRRVVGVEVTPAAIESARATAGSFSLNAEFICADAAEWAHTQDTMPDVLIVNPPRRGMGEAMSRWVEDSGIAHVIYSSCNPATLAKDLAQMPHYRITQARLLDMFPHTAHAEVLVRLERSSA